MFRKNLFLKLKSHKFQDRILNILSLKLKSRFMEHCEWLLIKVLYSKEHKSQ